MTENQIDLSGDGGVMKQILKEGEGNETPGNGCKVSVHYTGWTIQDGNKFDSSRDRNEPFEFDLGKGQVIKSWDIGVASMKKGEKANLTCKPDYAYGAGGSPPNIPGNSTLLFEVEVLGWKGMDCSPDGDFGVEKFTITKSEKKKTPNDGALVKCKIVGEYENRVFEERDVEFNLGEGEELGIIPGVEHGLEKMSQGEVARLVIKPKYAFGSIGHKVFNIPPNATVTYRVTLNEFEKAVESWKLDADESLKQGILLKEKGTNYFKQEKYKLALKFYEKAQLFVSNCETQEDGEAKTLNISIYLNKALCHQKLQNFDEMKQNCNEVLAIDSNNVKGIFRRASAYVALGDFESALEDFKCVHELEPNNKAAINQIAICQHRLKQYRDVERARYKNMFARIATSNSKNEAENADDAMTHEFGEWGKNERSHTPTEFERENPNILMVENEHNQEFKDM